MKFTEGFWLKSERMQASYGTQAFSVEGIPHGMRILAPERPILSRADALDQTVLSLEFTACRENDIRVRLRHYEAYDDHAARFELTEDPQETQLLVDEEQAVLMAGKLRVVVDRKTCRYRFEGRTADDAWQVLTGSDTRAFGYIRWDKKPSSMLPGDDYLSADYRPYLVQELSLAPGEYVYGFGEQFTSFTKNGQVIEIWNEDGGTASQVAYKNIPFYMTNRGYGVFVEQTGQVSFEVASEKVERVGFCVEGESLTWHLIYGPTPKEVLTHYTALTGRPALVPAWSFGLWLSTSFKPLYDEETTSAFIDGMAKRDIPLSVFHFDSYWMRALHWCDFVWDETVFPDVKAMLARYHSEKNVKICVWINPYIAQGNDTFREAEKQGFLLMRADGRGVKQIDHWQPGLALVDFTNPDAVRWYQDKIRALLDAGVDAIKTDFGERIPIDVRYFNGADPKSMHNYYTWLYNRAVFETCEEVCGKGNAVLFARSATAGGQQFPVHWGGDSFASYASMAETLRAGLSLAMSGFGYWSHDISGFEATAAPDLYKRWVQFGLLSSHSRLHGSDTPRVPWSFDEESVDVLRFFTKLKNSLMPYLFLKAVEAHETGIPMLRPMVLEFPEDPACRTLDMQYMLGESLLVAPIFNDHGEAEFYVPEGIWTDYFTGRKYDGGRWYRQCYDYFSLPLLVRPGTVLPVSSHDERPDYDYRDSLILKCYELREGEQVTVEIPSEDGREKTPVTVTLTDGLPVWDGAARVIRVERQDTP
ncbi:MAG: alpha-xylosidase [Lachnospiraceae bacterium]|nr:alpha-xylosidase [Lachnospiraceae bacterium]